MRWILLVLLMVVLVVGCGKPQMQNLEGLGQLETITDPSVYPSVVMVFLPEGRGLCSGTFISPKAVLTAAHCISGPGLYRIIAGFGSFTTYHYEKLGPGVVDDPNDLAVIWFDEAVASRRENQVSLIGSAASSGDAVRLVGFGCNDLDSKLGAGVKRTGTNEIAYVDDYIELLTPYQSTSRDAHALIGPGTRAGTCFGDSGGPLFSNSGSELSVVGVCHAGGRTSTTALSQFVNVNHSENRNFLTDIDSEHNLGIFEPCAVDDPMPGPPCSASTAYPGLEAAFKAIASLCSSLWLKITALFAMLFH